MAISLLFLSSPPSLQNTFTPPDSLNPVKQEGRITQNGATLLKVTDSGWGEGSIRLWSFEEHPLACSYIASSVGACLGAWQEAGFWIPVKGRGQKQPEAQSLRVSTWRCLDPPSTLGRISRPLREHPYSRQLQLFLIAAACAVCVVINKGNATVCPRNCALGAHSLLLLCRLLLILSSTVLVAFSAGGPHILVVRGRVRLEHW